MGTGGQKRRMKEEDDGLYSVEKEKGCKKREIQKTEKEKLFLMYGLLLTIVSLLNKLQAKQKIFCD